MTVEDGTAPDIVVSRDMTEFFRSVVDDAVKTHGYEATDAAETYVVGVLADYAKPDPMSEAALSRPLTLLLDEALHSVGQERFERLRTLGDGVLYVSGFFGDHLEQRGVHDKYVSTVGARAYDSAAKMLMVGESAGGPDLFRELATKFQMFMQLMRDVADALQARAAHSPTAMVRVYEKWLKTGSTQLAEALAMRGMVPTRGNGALH